MQLWSVRWKCLNSRHISNAEKCRTMPSDAATLLESPFTFPYMAWWLCKSGDISQHFRWNLPTEAINFRSAKRAFVEWISAPKADDHMTTTWGHNFTEIQYREFNDTAWRTCRKFRKHAGNNSISSKRVHEWTYWKQSGFVGRWWNPQ